nr:amidohydrolase family protein [Gemmatimonadota bacterium]
MRLRPAYAAWIVGAAVLVTSGAAHAQGTNPPGEEVLLLLENGLIWTHSADRPEATALLIRGGRVAWVGATGSAPVGAEVRQIDLGGRRVVPGFNDAHTHFFDGGFTLLAPDLLTSDTPEEFVRRLKEFVGTLPAGRWIDLSAAWDHERWPGHPLPSLSLIDSVTPANPVWIRRPDGHIGLANSLALELAG